MPTCNYFNGKPGCGAEIEWVPNPDNPGKKMKVDPGNPSRKHVCGGGKPEMLGFEQAQANSNTERILNTVIPKMVELQEQTCNKVHDEVETVTSIFNRMNVDFNNFTRDIDGRIKDIDTVLKIKKSDYSKSDTTGDIPDTLQKIDKNVEGLNDNFGRFAGAIEALLIQKGFVAAGELYHKEEQTKIES